MATVSIGVTTAVSSVGGTIRMPESLLLTADKALYKAKHSGRNRIEVSILLTSVATVLIDGGTRIAPATARR